MRTKKLIIIISMLSICFCLFGASKKSKTKKPDYSEQIKKSEDFLKQQKFAGAVLIAYKDEIVFSNGYGLCDEKDPSSAPITAESVFEIGSISKQFNSSAIMQLVQQNKLSVDDKLSKYFPDYEHGDEITIKNLLTMKSGIHSNLFMSKEEEALFNQMTDTNEELEDGFLLPRILETPLSSTPGTKFDYNNWNYYLLARIVEQVSGMKYYDYLQENFFIPFGMTSTNVETGKVDAIGYEFRGKALHPVREVCLGAGDINSNVGDLFKWTQNFVNNKVVNKDSVSEMTLDRKTRTQEYGYGFFCQGSTIFHTGSTYCYNSFMAYDYETEKTIIVLVNATQTKRPASTIATVLNTYWK